MRFLTIILISILLTGCMNETLKAPCDEHASFCGTKTKINRW